MTSLLDILKEADLRVGFADCLTSVATHERLDRDTLRKRLATVKTSPALSEEAQDSPAPAVGQQGA